MDGCVRRSELVALTVEDVGPATEGLVVRLRRSKGDQEGRRVAMKGILHAARPLISCDRSADAASS